MKIKRPARIGCIIKESKNAMMAHGGVELQLHPFLTSARDGNDRNYAITVLPSVKQPRVPVK
jgi:hypothetical protein